MYRVRDGTIQFREELKLYVDVLGCWLCEVYLLFFM